MVQESNCICGGCNDALKGETPVRLMDEFGCLWSQEVHLLKLPEYQPLTDIQQCQEILGSFENDQGTPPPPPC